MKISPKIRFTKTQFFRNFSATFPPQKAPKTAIFPENSVYKNAIFPQFFRKIPEKKSKIFPKFSAKKQKFPPEISRKNPQNSPKKLFPKIKIFRRKMRKIRKKNFSEK